MLRIQKSFVFVSVLALLACSQNLSATSDTPTQAPSPTFPPYMAGTQTAFASDPSTPTPSISDTETSLPPSTFTPTPATWPRDFSPLLYGKKYDANTFFLVLGGVSGDVWLTPEMSVARFAGEATYSLHTLEQEYKYFFWGKTPEPAPTCNSFTIRTDIDINEHGMVAILDGWNITKRAVTELPSNEAFYQQVVSDWLTTEGVSLPQIGTLQILRVDIEGDGTDEVFISATHLDDSQHTTKAGDYSIILLRKVIGNAVLTIPVLADIYRSQEPELTFPRTYSLANFIDLNQDGNLEVVVDIQKWEGFGAIVFQINAQNVIQALRAEC